MTQTTATNPPSSKFRLAQLILERKDIDLDDWLAEQRNAGHSLEQIARDLYVMTDLEVSVTLQTIGRWLEDRNIEEVSE